MADADPTALSALLDPVALIVRALRSLRWSLYLSWAASLVALPFQLLWIPVRLVAGLLLVVFSPALYVLGVVYASVAFILSFLARLEPLYTFFGAAATVGIITGLVLSVSSSAITSLLGMHAPLTSGHDPRRSRDDGSVLETDIQSDEESCSSSSSHSGRDWKWLERSPSRRRPAAGLLSQTILEEDDDSDGVAPR